jgi:BMFP domain-containing protein YqiC
MTTDSQSTTGATQPQTAEVKNPKVEPGAKDTTATSLPIATAVSAADSANLLAADSQTATQASQPQMAEVKTPEVQLNTKDSTAASSPIATAVSAADSASLLAAESQTATQASQLQTAEVKTPEVQLNTKDTSATSSPIAAATTAPGANTQVEPKAAEAKEPAKVAVTPSNLTPAAPAAEASAQTVTTPRAAEATVAQVTPAAPANTENLLDQINRYNREGSNSQGQVTNVTQLRDVSPNDWAYEALRSLVERYGCIAGYPDGTYRGNRALSRYEFAAGLNACLQQVERLIASNTSDFVRREDLAVLQRLIDEFRTELATLGTRVDRLEGRVGFLETHQFSTTTKLQGEAIFAITDEFNQDVSNNTVFQDRVRLTFNTSFTGRDRLVTRLSAGNANFDNRFKDTFGETLSEGQQTFNITGGSTNNSVELDWLAYYFNFGSSKVYLAATGGIHSDYAPTLNPYFEDYDGGNGALSTFASENPIYRIGGGAGGAISLGVGPLRSILGPSTLTVGYLAGASNGGFGANNPDEKAGLFDGDYAALGQLNFNLGDRVGVGLTYVHAYHNTGTDIFDLGGGEDGRVVGSALANRPSAFLNVEVPVVTNSYGGELAFRLTDNISLSGYATYTNAIITGRGTADIWTYGAGLAFPDFGKRGNVLGFFAGVEPTLRGADSTVRGNQGFSRDNSWHYEAFYKYQVTDNISVTPGIIWLTAPGQSRDNDDAVIGTLRTTFTF